MSVVVDAKRRHPQEQTLLLRVLAVLLFVLLLLGAGVAGGIVLDRQVLNQFVAPAGITASDAAQFKLMVEAWNSIKRNYVDYGSQKPQQLAYGAVSGMVDALGDTGHSRFMSPQMVQEENNYTNGSFDGIGAEVAEKQGNVVIVAPIDGSPAQKAGLRPGDIILKVDGQGVTDLPLEEVVSRILGPAGTSVTLTIGNPKTGQTKDYTLERAHITLRNVTWEILPGTTIAHLRIAGFSQGVSTALQSALSDMQKQGVTGVVLDLRNNPGGLLDESINTASQFLSSGNVLLEKNSRGTVTAVPVRKGAKATSLPMVVLINGGSASASEIVAGALQDAQRARLLGETTYGTGTVLNTFGLSDGSALLLATQEWLTPSGRVIWHKGISPDVTVTLPPDIIALTPASERGMTQEQLQASGDQQLLQALDLLLHPSS